jgi:hypothetical protein
VSDLSVHAALSMLLAVVAFSASGIGRVALAGARADNAVRTVVAEYVVGLLLFSTLLGIAAHLQLPLRPVAGFLGSLALVGLWPALEPNASRIVRGSRAPNDLRARCGIGVVLGVSFFASQATPVNPGALDPTIYAYMTTVLFHDGWVASNLTGFPDYTWLQATAQEGVLSRAPSLGLLWPAAALGLSLGARSTAAAAAWFLVPTVAALVDVLHGRAPLLARVILAIGGIGVFNEVAVLVDGQVNQTFALAVMVATVWGYRWLDSRRARCLLLALAGASIAAGYPEFLPAVPLYLLCCALLRTGSLRNTILNGAVFASGLLLVQLSTQLENAAYLLRQVEALPEWWPLPTTPNTVAEVWQNIVLERPPPPLLGIVLLPAGWWAWRSTEAPTSRFSPRLGWLILAALLAALGVWSWLALHSPNQNYATFKLGGWLGPGLFLCAFLLTGYATRGLGRGLATLILVLATTRVLGLVIDAPPKILRYQQNGPAPYDWELRSPRGASLDPCLIRPGSDENRTVMRAVAETAAPVRGCQLAPVYGAEQGRVR